MCVEVLDKGSCVVGFDTCVTCLEVHLVHVVILYDQMDHLANNNIAT
jgi:hypothetical protein